MLSAGDVILVGRLCKGDEKAFSLIYDKYWKVCYLKAHAYLKDELGAQDLVQDLFISIWNKRESLRIGNLKSYLLRSIRNNALRVIATNNASCYVYEGLELLEGTESPDNSLRYQELLTAYKNLLHRMPVKRQKIYKMRVDGELSADQIAAQLGLSLKTVRNQLSLAQLDLQVLISFFLIFSTFLSVLSRYIMV